MRDSMVAAMEWFRDEFGRSLQASTLTGSAPVPIPPGTAFQYKLYGAVCGQPVKLLTTFTALRITRSPTGVGSHCYEITAAALDSNGVAGPESAPSPFQIVNLPAEPPPPPPVTRDFWNA